ncbi:MAG TPA: acyltransferase [Thermohalobaculum sp.]|nr:acyltransferase [Thermohalobaculum sp.]
MKSLESIGFWLFPRRAAHAAQGAGYRPDVDGLRAVAVVSVLIFHLNDTLLSGGYAGVDVFFVISGYLITQLIHREIAGGNFSIVTFYERRARRIFPALIATMACTFVAGFLIFMPDELRYLGAGATAAAAFSANILF